MPWDRVRGATLEALVGHLTTPSGRHRTAVSCELVFVSHQRFFPGLALLRLLVHRFHSVPLAASGQPLPPVHERVLGLLRLWVRTALGDFLQLPPLLRAFKSFLLRLQCPAYFLPFERSSGGATA